MKKLPLHILLLAAVVVALSSCVSRQGQDSEFEKLRNGTLEERLP